MGDFGLTLVEKVKVVKVIIASNDLVFKQLTWVEKVKVVKVIIASNDLIIKQLFKILVRVNKCIQEGRFNSYFVM